MQENDCKTSDCFIGECFAHDRQRLINDQDQHIMELIVIGSEISLRSVLIRCAKKYIYGLVKFLRFIYPFGW